MTSLEIMGSLLTTQSSWATIWCWSISRPWKTTPSSKTTTGRFLTRMATYSGLTNASERSLTKTSPTRTILMFQWKCLQIVSTPTWSVLSSDKARRSKRRRGLPSGKTQARSKCLTQLKDFVRLRKKRLLLYCSSTTRERGKESSSSTLNLLRTKLRT